MEPSQYPNLGKMGEALTVYRLRQMGIRAEEVGGNLPFDVIALNGARPIRVQVKTTGKPRSPNRFRFLSYRGRYDTNDKIESYTTDDVDVVALVALPVEGVIFRPVQKIEPITTIPKKDFDGMAASLTTWQAAIKDIK